MCLVMGGCVTQASMGEGFEQSVKAFNRLLRWHELENAGMTYIEPQLRETYLKQADHLKKRGLTVTDFRIISSRYLPETKSGDVIAEFDYYMLPSSTVKTISYRQDWVYQESTKSWKLRSSLPTF